MSGTYNSVTPRVSLQNKQQHKNFRNPSNWPKNLHDFISRSFDRSNKLKLSPDEKKVFQEELKNLINKAIDTDKVEVNNWQKQELPTLTPEKPGMELQLFCDIGNASLLPSNVDRPFSTSMGFANGNGKVGKAKSRASKRNVFDEDLESDDDNNESDAFPIVKKRPKSALFASSLPALKKVKKEKKKEEPKPTLLAYNSKSSSDAVSSAERLKLRSQRFQKELSIDVNTYAANMEDDEPTNSDKPLIGTCQVLEKKYLRLTSQPNPETVRPLPVLRKTLQLLVDKYLTGASYNYLCDQFKSLRQDLTVQHIRSPFTVLAYEYNCMLAIEFQDLGEFNQCQSQLKTLYETVASDHVSEYRAYTVLYYIITNNPGDAFALKYSIMKQNFDIANDQFLSDAFVVLEYVKDIMGFLEDAVTIG
ncbi:unnamed protein product [Ambrosiozyma monospora]|uniref:Unnamed protein product n=1 Tax=Ambrosiozyma monospora TaxID=43982 RepID=A0A9W6YWH2_AMBMO|nr:unnamed protein product [Ambrosiozyma monospora]